MATYIQGLRATARRLLRWESMRESKLIASTILGVAGLLAAACGGGAGGGPCEGSNPDPICAQECSAANPCPPGFACADDGTCNAECTQAGAGCGANEICTTDGQCEPLIDADCPNVTLDTSRTTPTVELLIDQSGSMTAAFGGGDRWDGVRNALIDPTNGVVTNLEAAVYFGASLYTGTDQSCPGITSVPRALNNRGPIANLLNNNDPLSETPTGESIDAIVAGFATSPPPPNSPPIIVLATDGEPDTCAVPNPQEGQPESIAAATAAFQAGIRLYILSVGSEVGAPHLQDMANAGIGNNPAVSGTNAPFFVATTPQQLSDALTAIIGGIVSCELTLDGTIDPQAAGGGSVTLNGVELEQGTDWEVVDGDTIRLIGQACDDLLADSDATVTATFPCGVVVD